MVTMSAAGGSWQQSAMNNGKSRAMLAYSVEKACLRRPAVITTADRHMAGVVAQPNSVGALFVLRAVSPK